MPLPSAPKPQPSIDAPLPAAPRPNFAQNSTSPRDAIRNAAQGAMGARARSTAPHPGPPTAHSRPAPRSSPTPWASTSAAYMRRVHNDIQRNWAPLIPEEVAAPALKRGIVGIRFTILPDGRSAT